MRGDADGLQLGQPKQQQAVRGAVALGQRPLQQTRQQALVAMQKAAAAHHHGLAQRPVAGVFQAAKGGRQFGFERGTSEANRLQHARRGHARGDPLGAHSAAARPGRSRSRRALR